MTAILTGILAALGKVGVKVLTAALSETALTYLVIAGLEKLAKSTETDVDDKYVEEIKKKLK